MEPIFKKGDIVRAKRAHLKRLLHFPISRFEIMKVTDVHEVRYAGDDFTSIGVSVRDVNGEEFHYSQDGLEKI